jgi:hypothetical protein
MSLAEFRGGQKRKGEQMDKKITTQEEVEMLRKQVLEYLAGRHPLEWTQKQIAQGIKMRGMVDFDFGADDLKSALEVLIGKKMVVGKTEELGSTIYYSATADGLIEWERRH